VGWETDQSELATQTIFESIGAASRAHARVGEHTFLPLLSEQRHVPDEAFFFLKSVEPSFEKSVKPKQQNSFVLDRQPNYQPTKLEISIHQNGGRRRRRQQKHFVGIRRGMDPKSECAKIGHCQKRKDSFVVVFASEKDRIVFFVKRQICQAVL